MVMRMTLRCCIAAALFFSICSISAVASAKAATEPEICPAVVDSSPGVWIAEDRFQNGLRDYRLEARSDRSLTARFAAYTDKGYFTATLPEMALTTSGGKATGDLAARSGVFAIQFPAGTNVREVWLESATVTRGDPAWVAAGPITCTPGQMDPMALHPRPLPDAAQIAAMPKLDPSVVPIVAEAAPNLERTDCPVPFAPARTLKLAYPVLQPSMDQLEPIGPTDVEVTLNPDGSVAAADLRRSSGSPAFDSATIRAVEATTYQPAIAFCRPVFGRYIFRESYQSR